MKGVLRYMQYVFPCSLQCEDVISMDPGETLMKNPALQTTMPSRGRKRATLHRQLMQRELKTTRRDERTLKKFSTKEYRQREGKS